MKRILLLSLLAISVATQAAFAHDPRTVAKDFTHSLSVEGAGKLTISYKSLHYNEPAYLSAQKNEQVRERYNKGIWKKVGKLDTDFDVIIGGVQVPKGSYDLGVRIDGNETFKLLLASGGKEILIPLQTAADGPVVTYLSFDLRPANDTDTFIVEGRYGKARVSAEVKVPYLAPHEHTEKK
jgi:hypothetical protein